MWIEPAETDLDDIKPGGDPLVDSTQPPFDEPKHPAWVKALPDEWESSLDPYGRWLVEAQDNGAVITIRENFDRKTFLASAPGPIEDRVLEVDFCQDVKHCLEAVEASARERATWGFEWSDLWEETADLAASLLASLTPAAPPESPPSPPPEPGLP